MSAQEVYFTPPTVDEATSFAFQDGLFGRLTLARGVSVLKTDGAYRQVRQPHQRDLEAADLYYLGGHRYLIDEDEYADLVAAGYGDYIDIVPGTDGLYSLIYQETY